MTQVVLDLLMERQRALYNEGLAMYRRLFALPRVIEHARANHVQSTPHEVVHEEGSLRLLHYPRATPARYVEPVLVCYALVNRPYLLDLQPERSVIRQLLGRGFDVYLIDWGTPSSADQSLRLRDYVHGLMKRCADHALARAPASQFHLLGYCMGGTMSAMFTAVYPKLVKSLALMAAPIDFAGQESLLRVWSDPKYFDVDTLIDTFGNCPATFLQACFAALKPVTNLYTEYTGFYEKMDDDRFVQNFLAVEKWASDSVPMAGETFREFVKKLYQRNELVRGEFKLDDVPVDLRRITCPLLLLMASSDRLVPPAQTEGIEPHVGSTDLRAMTLDAGACRVGGQLEGTQVLLASGDTVDGGTVHAAGPGQPTDRRPKWLGDMNHEVAIVVRAWKPLNGQKNIAVISTIGGAF